MSATAARAFNYGASIWLPESHSTRNPAISATPGLRLLISPSNRLYDICVIIKFIFRSIQFHCKYIMLLKHSRGGCALLPLLPPPRTTRGAFAYFDIFFDFFYASYTTRAQTLIQLSLTNFIGFFYTGKPEKRYFCNVLNWNWKQSRLSWNVEEALLW